MTLTREYAAQIVRRGREPMEPVEFEVDWDDAPIRHKVYLGCEQAELPPGDDDAPVGSLARVVGLLRQSYAVTGRRTRISPNAGIDHQQSVAGTTLGRGSASGGGMYPVELYLVVGPGQGVLPGVYHYATAHDRLDRLLVGDYRARVRRALRSPEGADLPDVYVLAAVRFWKNSFKYNSFCYHVVTTDIGTLFGAWTAALEPTGARARVRLWFDEPDLDALLGLDGVEESVFAVVTTEPHRSVERTPVAGRDVPPGVPSDAGAARVDVPSYEKSRRLLTFTSITQVQAETLADDAAEPAAAACPSLETAERPDAAVVPLPLTGDPWRGWDLAAVAGRRRASFGLFSSGSTLTAHELAVVLGYASSAPLVELAGGTPQRPLLRLSAFANHVDGVPAGAYDHDPASGLVLVPGEPLHPFLQFNYYLSNYNLEQPGAVVVLSGRPEAVVDSLGPRGLRLLNAELGAAAQRVYLAAAALGVGCGAVLGFDNVSIQERLGRAGTDEWPLLMIMVGNERAQPGEYHYRLPSRELRGTR